MQSFLALQKTDMDAHNRQSRKQRAQYHAYFSEMGCMEQRIVQKHTTEKCGCCSCQRCERSFEAGAAARKKAMVILRERYRWNLKGLQVEKLSKKQSGVSKITKLLACFKYFMPEEFSVFCITC